MSRDDTAAETKRPHLIVCDQAGITRSSHYGFGTLWLPYDRRGDFARDFQTLQNRVGFNGTLQWSTILDETGVSFANELVSYFFRTRWLAFHCLVVETGIVDLECHGDDLDLAQRKHFTMLLANKLKASMRRRGVDQEYRAWGSPMSSRYDKAHEAAETISGHVVAQASGRRPNLSLSLRTPAVALPMQMCSILLGAVVDSWDSSLTPNMERVARMVSDRLDWDNLRYDTLPSERKFNVWKFYDPVKESVRSSETRTTRYRQKPGQRL